MDDREALSGKRVLIVDDEKDVLETLSDLLDFCDLDQAGDFETASRLLSENPYDLAIFDIMGVNGYELLDQAQEKNVPALMFTAHALSPDAFAKSMDGGAKAYIPKEEMANIASFAAEIIKARDAGIERPRQWFGRLRSFFDRQFGSDWMDRYKEAREKYPWLDFED